MQCANALKQIGIGFHNFHDTQQGVLPVMLAINRPTGFVLLFPYVEQMPMYELLQSKNNNFEQEFNKDFWGYTTSSRRMSQADLDALFSIPTYRCPTRRAPSAKDGIYDGTYGDGTTATSSNGPRNDFAFVAYVDRSIYSSIEWTNSCGHPDTAGTTAYDNNIAAIGSALRPAMLRSGATAWQWQYWTTRDTMARFTDGTSNTFIVGEKHIHANNIRKWTGTTLGYNENGYVQDCAYTHTTYNDWGRCWFIRSFFKHNTNDVYGIARGANDRETSQPNVAGFGSWHPGICPFLFADGSVMPISNTTPTGNHDKKLALVQLSDVADGGVVSLE
jgi:hypothetical protein